MKKSVIFLNFVLAILFSCQQQKSPSIKNIVEPKRQQPKTISYEIENAKQWLLKNRPDSNQQRIAFAVNRTDSSNFAKMDSILMPTDLTGDIEYYLSFPLTVPYLQNINKVIFFSYRTQTFATYEKGILMYTGPTNMGRKKDLTPTGLFYTNWKAEETISTFNDEWNLRWNFNIANKEGIGWHQYSLPGYPASHSCLRIQEKDAQYLYNWADQWVLTNKDSIVVKGTPVIVFGSYDFNGPKPWLQLISNPHAMDITKDDIQKEATAFINEILIVQKEREAFMLTDNKN
jgi:hypothetical protein